VTPDSTYTPDVSSDKVTAAINASVSAWNSTGCSYFSLKVDPPEAGGNATMERPTGKNFVVFRQDSWCPPDANEPCYDTSATALTTVFYIDKPGDSHNGQILDADVEMNNINFAFTVDGTRPPGSGSKAVADIQNTLTHELGHLLGLDHTCYDGWNPCETTGRCKAINISCQTEDDCIPFDDKGQRVPRCTDVLPSEVTEATMFNYAQSLDTSKRTLSQDDVDGVCGIYPVADDPGSCSRVDTAGSTGCAASAQAPTAGGLLLLLALALAVARRRS
jgi:MYXO-CTERM domain-containing protein